MSTMRLTLLTDLYELTMMQGYFKNQNNETVVFDVFYRKNPSGSGFAIAAGLDQVIDYIRNLTFQKEDIDYLRSLKLFDEDFLEYLSSFRFSGDIYAIPEGTVVFPREPLLKVIAPIMEAQLIETAILTIVNHQSLIATKAARVVYAAAGDGVMEFYCAYSQVDEANEYTGAYREEIYQYQDGQAVQIYTGRVLNIGTSVQPSVRILHKDGRAYLLCGGEQDYVYRTLIDGQMQEVFSYHIGMGEEESYEVNGQQLTDEEYQAARNEFVAGGTVEAYTFYTMPANEREQLVSVEDI